MIGNSWDSLLEEEMAKPYFKDLQNFLEEEYAAHTVYPPEDKIYNALRYTAFDDVKVVILGQDPYHEPGQAHGLAFSVPVDMPQPPSLINIIKELTDDTAVPKAEPEDQSEGLLVPWAKQGVLLLNTVLTVRAHEAGSHRAKGWEIFTDAIINKLAKRDKPMVFILWGAPAAKKKELILEASQKTGTRHLIITAPHPSPLSAYRGFFGGRYFSRSNYFLEDIGEEPINWNTVVRS